MHAGRKVAAPPPSSPRQPGGEGRIRVDSRFRGLVEKAPALGVEGPFISAAVPEDLEDLRAKELKAIGKVTVPRSLDNPNAGLVQLLKHEAQRRLKVETKSLALGRAAVRYTALPTPASVLQWTVECARKAGT